MNPIAKRGGGIMGLAAYILHDPEGAFTDTRVPWTATRNIPTSDPHKAVKWMAWTAMHGGFLKKRAGVPPTGRKSSKKNVLHGILTWHPDEDPDRKTMEDAVDGALQYLGLEDHECVMCPHTDKKHPHIHFAVGLVHPEHGRVANIHNYQERLQDYAYQFDPGASEQYAPQRVKHVKLRRQGKRTKYRDSIILEAARDAVTLHDFAVMLEEKGYRLAVGDRVVVVGRGDSVNNPLRHVNREDRLKLKRWFKGDVSWLPSVGEVTQQATAPTVLPEQFGAMPPCLV